MGEEGEGEPGGGSKGSLEATGRAFFFSPTDEFDRHHLGEVFCQVSVSVPPPPHPRKREKYRFVKNAQSVLCFTRSILFLPPPIIGYFVP